VTFSPGTPGDLGVHEAGLPLLRDLIHERTGLFYDTSRYDSLSDRLAPLVLERGFRSFLDFYYLLKYDQGEGPAEWRKVIDALSVPETYFWREIDQLRGIACRLLPDLARAARHRPIRIWSVPCASGEEPLTIAMVLEETGWFQRAEIEIHGSDGSEAQIAKARAARYRERSFRALPAELREKYFEPANGAFTPVADLRNRVTSWSVVNLMSDSEVAEHARSPVIVCRNAFIYFSPQSVRKVVDTFAAYMPTPAYLLIGASESLMTITDRFMLDDLDRSFVYVKR
jgi:chemotaxis protein methyltransferase CheR